MTVEDGTFRSEFLLVFSYGIIPDSYCFIVGIATGDSNILDEGSLPSSPLDFHF